MELKLVILLVFLSVLNVGHSGDPDITKNPPTYDKPWVPAWGWFGPGPKWKNMHEKMLNQTLNHKKDIKIVFFGDSKTEGWIGPGLKVWEKYYVKRGGYNYGIGGDSTRQVLWRIKYKELDGIKPKILVFMIGGNNFGNNFNRGTDLEIYEAEHFIFNKIHEILPKTQIIFVPQLPRGDIEQDKRARHINSIWEANLKPLSVYIHYVICYTNFTKADHKTQNTDLYIGDHIHLNEKGYELLAQILEPLIKKYL